jgi:spore coat protein U-like protein
MCTRSVLRLSVAAALLAASGIALPASTPTSIPVSATVSAACTISTASAIAFGAYDPIGANATAALTATGSVSVVCSKGATGLTIGIDNGAHSAGAQRQMVGAVATNLLQYNLYQPPNATPGTACTFPGTIAWTTAAPLGIATAPSKVARTFNVCGTVPAGQDAATGAYTDVVVATLNF